ncbi:MAG TPA: GNAT family N-acetyltransferase [Anaerolineales bacterium]
MNEPYPELIFRPETLEDEAFLRHLILETLTEQLAVSSWPDAIRGPLLETQYQVRRQGFRSVPHAVGRIVVSAGQPIGWYVTADLDQEIRLVNIMVLASHRGRGVGASIVRALIADSDRSRKPVRLKVDVRNTGAFRLYERLGFQRIGGDEVQHCMEHSPGGRDA